MKKLLIILCCLICSGCTYNELSKIPINTPFTHMDTHGYTVYYMPDSKNVHIRDRNRNMYGITLSIEELESMLFTIRTSAPENFKSSLIYPIEVPEIPQGF